MSSARKRIISAVPAIPPGSTRWRLLGRTEPSHTAIGLMREVFPASIVVPQALYLACMVRLRNCHSYSLARRTSRALILIENSLDLAGAIRFSFQHKQEREIGALVLALP